MAKKGLGRGLEALIPQGVSVTGENNITEIEIDEVFPNRYQPRREFAPETLQELAASIQAHGVIQPVVLRPRFEGGYELVAGERRWRACQLLGMKRIPAVIRDLSPREQSALALVENLQREDLNPLEEAIGYRRLMDEFSLTQEELAKEVGKSRSAIANTLRLLQLPTVVQEMIAAGTLSGGHARALLPLADVDVQLQVAEQVAAEGLSVRQTEELVRAMTARDKTKAEAAAAAEERRVATKAGEDLDVTLREVEERIRRLLGTQVKIKGRGSGRGKIEINYFSTEELARIVEFFLGQDGL